MCTVLANWQQANKATTAIRDKFSGPKYHCVANLVPPVELPDWLFQPLTTSSFLQPPPHARLFAPSDLHLPLQSASAMQLHGPHGFPGLQAEQAENLIPALHGLL